MKALMTTFAAVTLVLGTAGASDAALLQLFPPRQPPPQSPPPQSSAPAPAPSSSGEGKQITYSVSEQRVWLHEGQNMISTYAVSGRRGYPRAGTYHVFSKSRWATSGSVRMEFMVRFIPGGKGGKATGFHAIPVSRSGQPIQSESELGQYRSHGCVRQARAQAEFLYDWATMRTPVVVRS